MQLHHDAIVGGCFGFQRAPASSPWICSGSQLVRQKLIRLQRLARVQSASDDGRVPAEADVRYRRLAVCTAESGLIATFSSNCDAKHPATSQDRLLRAALMGSQTGICQKHHEWRG